MWWRAAWAALCLLSLRVVIWRGLGIFCLVPIVFISPIKPERASAGICSHTEIVDVVSPGRIVILEHAVQNELGGVCSLETLVWPSAGHIYRTWFGKSL